MNIYKITKKQIRKTVWHGFSFRNEQRNYHIYTVTTGTIVPIELETKKIGKKIHAHTKKKIQRKGSNPVTKTYLTAGINALRQNT